MKWYGSKAYEKSKRRHAAGRKPPSKTPASYRITKLICELRTNNVSHTKEQLIEAFGDLLTYITQLEERVRKNG